MKRQIIFKRCINIGQWHAQNLATWCGLSRLKITQSDGNEIKRSIIYHRLPCRYLSYFLLVNHHKVRGLIHHRLPCRYFSFVWWINTRCQVLYTIVYFVDIWVSFVWWINTRCQIFYIISIQCWFSHIFTARWRERN